MRKCLEAGRSSIAGSRLVLLSAALAAVPLTATAQTRTGSEPAPEVVVTATRLGVGLPGTSTTIVTAEDIEKSAATSIPDLLGREAGIQPKNFFSASGAKSAVDLRGFGATGANNTLVLVNGRRLNDFDLAAVDWSNIPLQSIERIEITRGNSGAVLYGEGAVGGVINIVTKTDVEDGSHGSATVKYGSYVYREADLSLTHRVGRFSLSAYGTGINARNYRHHNDLIQRNLVTELRYRGDDGDLYVNIGADDQTLDTPGPRLVTLTSTELEPESVRRGTSTPDDFSQQSGLSITMGGNHAVSDSIEAVLDIGYRKKDQDAFFQFTAVDTELANWSITPRLNIDFDALERPSQATVGIDYIYSDYSSDRQSFVDNQYSASQHSAAIYAQNTLSLTDHTDLSFGGRFQVISFSAGDALDPSQSVDDDIDRNFALNLGIEERFSENVAVFGRIARSFRAPTIDERILPDPGNPPFTLDTQTSRDAEVGTRLRFGDLELTSSAFYMALRNELHFDPNINVFGTNTNLDPTRRYGVENSLDWQANDTLRIKANLTYTKAEFTDGPYEGNTVPLVSDWTAGISANWDIVDKLLSLTASANYYSSKNMENDEANFQPEMPGYTLVDLKIGGEYHAFTWAASVNNVFDIDYYDYATASQTTYGRFNAYPLPGRTFLVQAGVEF